ncbi:hypothetical protein MVES1_001127 [Malassezia vespertilionis]|uniref:CLASP N-terminal domain-containing protein n=1 Tax=Malassezia vespertilionis TaxID=2020962 RepID=A0A2N1JEL1_9BASI|nr:uncharacterized protein MVES1_001127 [Malassezia vespertilionis]PKI84956.1 hypothetical protein MVES_001062 [Malassezia vespertilionis]WFD05793.1 hypothetical protein MVES1_001127 [Malassezia vespertilionis]
MDVGTEAAFHAWVARTIPTLELKETEETWGKIDAALAQFQAETKNGATRLPIYIATVRKLAPCITNSLLSERTKLSGTAFDVLNSMAPRLGERFAALLPLFIPPLLQNCSRTNKVSMKRAEKTLHLICRHCKPATIIPYLRHALQEKAPGLRTIAAGCLVVLIEAMDTERVGKRVVDVEHCIRAYATDASAQVRAQIRTLYGLFMARWPDHVPAFSESLALTSRRYLAGVESAPYVEPAKPAKPTATRTVLSTEIRPRVAAPELARSASEMHPKPLPGQVPRAVTQPVPQILRSPAAPLEEECVPQPVSNLVPPPRGAAPSEGVAYRLALAQEQAKLRIAQRQVSGDATPRMTASRALFPTAPIGSARRVAVPRTEAAPKPSASFSRSTGKSAVLYHGAQHPVSQAARKALRSSPHTPQRATPADENQDITPPSAKKPTKSPTARPAQFTPQRKPFAVLNVYQPSPRVIPPQNTGTPDPVNRNIFL